MLKGQSTSRFHIGCAEQLAARLAEHPRGQTISTRGRGPRTLVHQEPFPTLSEARRREQQLKSWKSHRTIRELIESSRKKS
ncbi:MAG: GIY-YIG nuclease family protein [Terracidiphilus sp.]